MVSVPHGGIAGGTRCNIRKGSLFQGRAVQKKCVRAVQSDSMLGFSEAEQYALLLSTLAGLSTGVGGAIAVSLSTAPFSTLAFDAL